MPVSLNWLGLSAFDAPHPWQRLEAVGELITASGVMTPLELIRKFGEMSTLTLSIRLTERVYPANICHRLVKRLVSVSSRPL